MDDVAELCALIEENVAGSPAPDDIRPDTQLLVSGLLDSLAIMRIVSEVEKRHGVPFPETAIVAANFRTPAALWSAIQELRPRQEHEAAV